MSLIIQWFLAQDDESAAGMVADYERVLAQPGVRVGFSAVVYASDLDAALSGRTVGEVREATSGSLLATHEEAVIRRLSPTLVQNLAETEDDAMPLLARSWAAAVGDEEPFDDAEALWILQAVVPLFRRAKVEGLRGYEFANP